MIVHVMDKESKYKYKITDLFCDFIAIVEETRFDLLIKQKERKKKTKII